MTEKEQTMAVWILFAFLAGIIAGMLYMMYAAPKLAKKLSQKGWV